MDDKELQEIREAIESGDLTHGHVYQLLAEIERIKEFSFGQVKSIMGYGHLYGETVKQLNELRRYVMSHDILIGESTAWTALKKMYGVGEYADQAGTFADRSNTFEVGDAGEGGQE
ncbi:MAG: hypothetical protein WC657_06935 [Candidatus Paceibacterota bacterium]|jgi:hypothetical protein